MHSRRSANPFWMPDWSGMYAPRGRSKHGRSYGAETVDPAEMFRQMTDAYNAIYAPLLENLTRYWGGSTAAPWSSGVGGFWPGWPEPSKYWRYRRGHGCGCDEGDCDGYHRDDCHCRCCVTDADLVVHARLGETRVVPLTIENPRRREREVRLELSNWTTRRGSPANVRATILPPTEFTLEPCGEREVVIGIQVQFRPEGDATGEDGQREPLNAEAGLAGMAARIREVEAPDRRLPDVDQCEVYYADLRAEGCEIRPIRIAVAVLPRDCGAHPVDCGCSCCR